MDFISLFYLATLVLWISALVHCLRGNSPDKVVWVIVIILVPPLGSILYFLIGRAKK